MDFALAVYLHGFINAWKESMHIENRHNVPVLLNKVSVLEHDLFMLVLLYTVSWLFKMRNPKSQTRLSA